MSRWGRGGEGTDCLSQTNPVGFFCCNITRGLTSILVCLDVAILGAQSSPQPWTLLLAGACHFLRVLAVPRDPQRSS